MARDMTKTGPTLASPPWTNDFLGREHLVPGGSKLDEAQFAAVNGKKHVLSGTVIGRTLAERDAGTGFGPAADLDDDVFIVAFDVDDAAKVADVELVRHNTTLKENFLPGWAGLVAAVKAAVRERYICMRGAE